MGMKGGGREGWGGGGHQRDNGSVCGVCVYVCVGVYIYIYIYSSVCVGMVVGEGESIYIYSVRVSRGTHHRAAFG